MEKIFTRHLIYCRARNIGKHYPDDKSLVGIISYPRRRYCRVLVVYGNKALEIVVNITAVVPNIARRGVEPLRNRLNMLVFCFCSGYFFG